MFVVIINKKKNKTKKTGKEYTARLEDTINISY